MQSRSFNTTEREWRPLAQLVTTECPSIRRREWVVLFKVKQIEPRATTHADPQLSKTIEQRKSIELKRDSRPFHNGERNFLVFCHFPAHPSRLIAIDPHRAVVFALIETNARFRRELRKWISVTWKRSTVKRYPIDDVCFFLVMWIPIILIILSMAHIITIVHRRLTSDSLLHTVCYMPMTSFDSVGGFSAVYQNYSPMSRVSPLPVHSICSVVNYVRENWAIAFGSYR